MLGLLSLIPGLGSIAQGIAGAYFDKQVRLYMAKTGTSRDVAVAAIQAMASVQDRWWFVAALVPAFALPFVIWTWKAVVWDKIVMAGATSTDPLTGTLGWAYTIIVSSIFVHGMVDSFKRST